MAVEYFPVEAGHIAVFAAALGDDNPAYRIGAVDCAAPPTFVQASEHFDSESKLRPRIGQPWLGSAAAPSGTSTDHAGSPSGERAGVLHAEQHYTYHRPVRPGDVLRATTYPGPTWRKQGKRSGALTFHEVVTEYHDSNGELVVTARAIGVQTERIIETPAQRGGT